jgi:DNA-nicking Smr family endonuclease
MSDEKSSRPRRMRRLSEEEQDLWSIVARSIKPLRSGRKVAPRIHVKAPPNGMKPDGAAHKVVRKIAPVPVAAKRAPTPATPAPIMRREKQQLSRGSTAIDARIDLHGMTQAEAHDALRRFLFRAQTNGAKFVLVITGKGGPDRRTGERGILRRQVPLWLALPELRGCVFGFDVAHGSHGGEGALYIRLRKARG